MQSPSLRSVLWLPALLLLAACEGQKAEGPMTEAASEAGDMTIAAPTEVRACDSGAVVAIDYLGTDQIRLTRKTQVWTLDQVPAGQGLRYRAEGVDWTVTTRDGEEVGRLVLTSTDKKPVVAEQCRRPASQLAVAPKDRAMRPCISPDLAYGVEAGDAGMGHRLTTIRLENRGVSPCQLEGPARVAVVDSAGKALNQIKAEIRTEGYFGRIQAGVPILLKTGEKAYFDLGWSVIPNEAEGERTCPEGTSLRLAPPGDNGGKTLALAIAPCSGKIEVSPYRVLPDRATVARETP